MTREEAIKILRDCKSEAPPEENWVNAFVALGILKLDEPKNAETKFEDAWLRLGFGHSDLGRIGLVLANNRLKIVEK